MRLKISFKRLLMLTFFCFVVGCQTISTSSAPQPGFITYYAEPVSYYLDMAATASTPNKQSLELKAAGRMLQDRSFVQAQDLLSRIEVGPLSNQIQAEKWLLLANLAALQQRAKPCLAALSHISQPNQLNANQKIAYYQLQAACNSLINRDLQSAEARIALDVLLTSESARHENRQAIWTSLNQLPPKLLQDQLQNNPYGQLQAWLELVYINKQYANDASLLNQERRQWQLKYPQHPANVLFPAEKASYSNPLFSLEKQPHQALRVALLLPTTGELASSARAIQSGFMAAKQDYQGSANTPITVEIYNTSGTNLQSIYKNAVDSGANLVVGPLTKSDVEALEKSGSLAVPTLALNFTNAKARATKNLYEYALSPQDEAYQAAKKMIHDGHKRVVMLTPAGSWGHSIATAFEQSYTSMGGQIIDALAYSGDLNSLDTAIKKLLRVSDENRNRKKSTATEEDKDKPQPQVRRQDIDAIFMIATPQEARQLKPLLSFYYAGDIPVYATSHVYTGTPNAIRDKDLNDIRFCDTPWMLTTQADVQKAKQSMHEAKPATPAQKARLFAFGYDAFKLATHLSPFTLSQGYIHGTTGTLYLNDHQIYRQLEWAQFRNGLPKHIN